MKVGFLGVGGLLIATAALPGFAQDSIYACTDASGRRITSDRPIIQCIDREQRELNPSGTVKRTVGPSLTAQERAAKEEVERREAEETARIAEERRRDRALLSRYKNRDAHDEERGQALLQVDAVIGAAKKRVTELAADRKQLDQEMEFYAKDPKRAPASLRRQITGNEQSIALQQRFIADQQGEKQRINERFDEELARLTPLWTAAGVPSGRVKPVSPSATR
ncbi:MAG: DUF4124 domain-containing protein [Burkholderiales bacterium]